MATYDPFVPAKSKPAPDPNPIFDPAKPKPQPKTMHQRFPWLPATGDADTHLSPAVEPRPKASAATPREIAARLTASIAVGLAARNWVQK